jgi:SAM-dependent methyltransferase
MPGDGLMSVANDETQVPEQKPAGVVRSSGYLFLISWLILFLELACIRWFPAHVLFLTFFTNTVLLACFLGMSIGCLGAGQKRNWLTATPVLLGVAMAAAHGIEYLSSKNSDGLVDVGNQASPQMVYFGTEAHTQDLARFVIPHEVIGGFFFLVIALAMVGPGQELGRALNRVPNRVQAYTVNIVGSIVGILLFSLCSWQQLSPFWWFLPIVLTLGYGVVQYSQKRDLIVRLGLLGLVLVAASVRLGAVSGSQNEMVQEWSPYYRIDYHERSREISVNLIGHQTMVSRDGTNKAYAIPHLLNRDARRVLGEEAKPFSDILIIGAGSGNDVSRALQWDAKHIDAVEIDPVIHRLGKQFHPDRPYQDDRVTVHLDDGREFLRTSDRQYDLIIYALVDSLILHSSYSNIRLESYLFTREAFEEVHRHLKPGGLFVMYNYFRQGWIVARLQKGLQEAFGTPPLVLTLPYQDRVEPEQGFGGFTLFFSGDGVDRLEKAFRRKPAYWVSAIEPANPASPNGFELSPASSVAQNGTTGYPGISGNTESAWLQFGPATVIQPTDDLRIATDDWPFLYLRRTMIPDLTLRGVAIMGGLGLLLVYLFIPRGRKAEWGMNGRMFFLGAGFMLVETTAVVRMALLFGSTWIVNAVVFLAVLVMILGANLFVLKWRPQRLWPYYVGLLASLAVNVLTPLDFFPTVLGRGLGLAHSLQVAGACLVVFTPILFAGVIFAVSFARTPEADLAFGANIAGAMVGGLAENSSMLLGFQYLLTVSIVFYVLSAFVVMVSPGWRSRAFPPLHPQ